MKANTLSTLRNRQSITLFDKSTKLFTHIQFNKKENDFVCWERWVSYDRRNWVNHNLYLSLHDIDNILNNLKNKKT